MITGHTEARRPSTYFLWRHSPSQKHNDRPMAAVRLDRCWNQRLGVSTSMQVMKPRPSSWCSTRWSNHSVHRVAQPSQPNLALNLQRRIADQGRRQDGVAAAQGFQLDCGSAGCRLGVRIGVAQSVDRFAISHQHRHSIRAVRVVPPGAHRLVFAARCLGHPVPAGVRGSDGDGGQVSCLSLAPRHEPRAWPRRRAPVLGGSANVDRIPRFGPGA